MISEDPLLLKRQGKRLSKMKIFQRKKSSITRGKTNVNKFENEVAFARSYLAKAGYIDKSKYGIWMLTDNRKKCRNDR